MMKSFKWLLVFFSFIATFSKLCMLRILWIIKLFKSQNLGDVMLNDLQSEIKDDLRVKLRKLFDTKVYNCVHFSRFKFNKFLSNASNKVKI